MMIRVPRSTLAGVLAHELHDLVEGRVVQPVDLVVLDGDLAGGDGIDIDQGPQHAMDQDRRPLGHLGQVDVLAAAAAPGRA